MGAGSEVMPVDHIKKGVAQCCRNVWIKGTDQLQVYNQYRRASIATYVNCKILELGRGWAITGKNGCNR